MSTRILLLTTTALLATLAVAACGDDRINGPPEPGPTSDILLVPSQVTLDVGQTVWLRTNGGSLVAPPLAYGWKSSDPTVAEVSPWGLVTALAPGSVTITCEGVDGNGTASVTVR